MMILASLFIICSLYLLKMQILNVLNVMWNVDPLHRQCVFNAEIHTDILNTHNVK